MARSALRSIHRPLRFLVPAHCFNGDDHITMGQGRTPARMSATRTRLFAGNVQVLVVGQFDLVGGRREESIAKLFGRPARCHPKGQSRCREADAGPGIRDARYARRELLGLIDVGPHDPFVLGECVPVVHMCSEFAGEDVGAHHRQTGAHAADRRRAPGGVAGEGETARGPAGARTWPMDSTYMSAAPPSASSTRGACQPTSRNCRRRCAFCFFRRSSLDSDSRSG